MTGGSRGIGKAIVQRAGERGAKVAFVYKGSADAAKSLEAEIAAAGGIAKAHQGDVADPAAAERDRCRRFWRNGAGLIFW